MPDSLKGHLLVASPKLRDSNFFRAVVLMVQHDERGSLGLVLNRPMEVSVRDAWRRLSEMPCEIEGNLHKGGPCEGVLMALHTDLEASDVEVLDGVHFSTTKDAIEHLVAHSGSSVRLFVGYAGWSPGQLEAELTEGAWHTTAASRERVFDVKQGSWELLVRAIGRAALTQWVDPKNMPEDPSVN